MSVKMMGLVWDADIERKKKYVLLAYADHADHDGHNVFPSVGLIARKTGYSERNIQRITQELVDAGFLIPEGTSHLQTNKYRMNVELIGGDKLSGVTKRQGDKTTQGGDKVMSPEPSLEPSVKSAPAAQRLEALRKKLDPMGMGFPFVPETNDKPDLSWVPEIYLEYARAFTEATGIKPVKADEKKWIKGFAEWTERGFTPALIKQTINSMRDENLTISSPLSITNNAIDQKAKATTNHQPERINRALQNARKE